LTSSDRPGRGLIAPLFGVAAAIVLTVTIAHAQNLDEGKPPAKLFADGCASCHRSPRGLAKGRFSFTLYWFLKDHYATSADSAKALASYLESVDSAAGAKPRGAAKSSKPAGTSRSSLRPPAPLPQR
jgi:mono/diheme cytochrome c family protein